jgi:hypothetical protein
MAKKELTDAASAFLAEYAALCRKYHLVVDSCGDCDSPWLAHAKRESSVDAHIEHLRAYAEGYGLTKDAQKTY